MNGDRSYEVRFKNKGDGENKVPIWYFENVLSIIGTPKSGYNPHTGIYGKNGSRFIIVSDEKDFKIWGRTDKVLEDELNDFNLELKN